MWFIKKNKNSKFKPFRRESISKLPWHSIPLRGTEPCPNSRLALSHQLKKRWSQDVRNISKTETGSYHDSMDDPWCPSDRSWTKDWVGDVFEVLSISEPATMSLEVDEHFRSLTNMWTVDLLWIWTVSKCTDYLSMKVIVLKCTPEVLDDIKPL